MKTLRHKSGKKWGDSDRFSHAFFIIGSLVVLTVVFFIGLQVGRIIEKDQAGSLSVRRDEGRKREDIQQEMSKYSAEAVQIPVVVPPPPPPTEPSDASEELKKSEKEATFPDSLTRKDAVPQPLVKPKEPAPASKPASAPKSAAASPAKKFTLQVSASGNREASDDLKAKLDKKGFKAKVSRENTGGKELYKVKVGPYGSKEEAAKVKKDIRAALNIDALLISE